VVSVAVGQKRSNAATAFDIAAGAGRKRGLPVCPTPNPFRCGRSITVRPHFSILDSSASFNSATGINMFFVLGIKD